MVIYVDLIIIFNFLIDLLLLIGVSVILKRKPNIVRIIIASIFGSLSTILLFYINNNLLLLTYKFITSIIMIVISFKYQNFNYFKDNLVYLYILSIILGGTIYLLNDTVTLSNKGYIFKNNGLKINLYLLLLISPIIIIKYINKQKHYQTEYQNYYNIEIYYNDKVIKDTAFLDTGNNLKDPYFHKPIILVNSSLIQEHIKTFLVPYYTVNNKDLLEVFSPQKILVNNKKTKKALIGLSDVNINGIKIILNKEILWES